MKLNKKGFTLMEVLTVIIIITILMMITLPLINSISERNKEELYHSYEKMMEEYAMASGIKNKTRIELSELGDLNETLNKEGCTGCVIVTKESYIDYKGFVNCDKYKTADYEINCNPS